MPERVDVDDDVAALKENIEQTERLIKAVNEVSSGVRKGEIDPELLARLDLDAKTARGFGKAFDRTKTEDKKIGVTTRDGADDGKPEKDDNVKEGDQVHETGVRPEITDTVDTRSGDLSADKLRELIESGKVDVSPEYRRLVERYFADLDKK